MKSRILSLFLLCFITSGLTAREDERIRYVDASELSIINNAMDAPSGLQRLNTDTYPDLSDRVRKFYGYSTGLAVRFNTDSDRITARWKTASDKVGNNKTPLAQKGMDLYILRDGEWVFAGVAGPESGRSHKAVIVENMAPGKKECLLYLPLYNRLDSLEIGVAPEALIEAGENPFNGKVVVLGSSITHGSSAGRPGMAYTARMERSLGIEMANLGVSGRFKLDSFFLPVIADIKCDAFIIDAFSNPNAGQIKSRLEDFVAQLRVSHPETPVIFLQTLVRETGNFNLKKRAFEAAKRAAADSVMNIVTGRFDDVYFINPGMDIGDDHEGTVDGTHPNDMGIDRMLASLEPQIARILASYGMKIKGTYGHSSAALDTLRNNYQQYPFHEIADTPAPKGYKAFYMSHYGRHGSRYLERKDIIDDVIGPLEFAQKQGNLTPVGEMLLADLHELDRLSYGMYGQITEKGGRELTALGERCARRFPEIFGGKERNQLFCVASPRQRCIMSMTYYVSSILRAFPKLETEYFTGDRYLEYICKSRGVTPVQQEIRQAVDGMYREEFDKERLCSALFTDPGRMDFNPWHFSEMLFHCAADITCLEAELDIFKYFTPEETRTLQRLHNNRVYYTHGNSAASIEDRLPDMHALVEDIITRAETAVAGNKVAADFRFGHDSGLIPLMTIFNMEGYDEETTLDNADRHWNASRMSPMAANFQMILYRSPKSEKILVKMLFNEQEVRISGPEAVSGPYYDWNDLVEHLRSRTK